MLDEPSYADSSSSKLVEYFSNLRKNEDEENILPVDTAGAPIYNNGEDLRKDLIDVSKAFNFIEDFENRAQNQDLEEDRDAGILSTKKSPKK